MWRSPDSDYCSSLEEPRLTVELPTGITAVAGAGKKVRWLENDSESVLSQEPGYCKPQIDHVFVYLRTSVLVEVAYAGTFQAGADE